MPPARRGAWKSVATARRATGLRRAVATLFFAANGLRRAVATLFFAGPKHGPPGPWGNTWARNTFLRSRDRLPLHDAVRGMLKEQNRKAVKRARRMEKQA